MDLRYSFSDSSTLTVDIRCGIESPVEQYLWPVFRKREDAEDDDDIRAKRAKSEEHTEFKYVYSNGVEALPEEDLNTLTEETLFQRLVLYYSPHKLNSLGCTVSRVTCEQHTSTVFGAAQSMRVQKRSVAYALVHRKSFMRRRMINLYILSINFYPTYLLWRPNSIC